MWEMKRCLGPTDLEVASFDSLEEGISWLKENHPEYLSSSFNIIEESFVQYGTNYGWVTFTKVTP